jgi:hypothetical protein
MLYLYLGILGTTMSIITKLMDKDKIGILYLPYEININLIIFHVILAIFF